MALFRRRCSATDIAVLTGLGMLCLPLWLSLIPILEQGRTEARISWAFIQVRQLQNEIASFPDAANAKFPTGDADLNDARAVTQLSEVDPWGQRFQMVTSRDGSLIRVFSRGPDLSSTKDGLDPDDIASDMTVRPTKRFDDRRHRQWLIALSVTGAVWSVAGWCYFSRAS